MASLIPKWVKKEIVDAWVGETLRLMLLSDAHTPNASTQRYISDVVANEINDSGGVYIAGGVLLSTKTAQPDGNNYYLDNYDITIGPGANLNYRYAVIYKDTGSQALSPIRAQIEFTANQIVLNGTSTINWNALGIIYVS